MTRDRSLVLMTTKRNMRLPTYNGTPYVDQVRFTGQDVCRFGKDVKRLLLCQPSLPEEMLLHKVYVGHHMSVAWWAVLPDEELVVCRLPTDRF